VKVGALCIKKEGAHFDTPSFFILVLSFPIMRTFHNNLNWNDNINETLGEHTNKKELLPLFSKETVL